MAHVKHPVVQGARYHSLVIKKEVPRIHVGKYAVRMVSCACDCGKEIVARFEYVRSGHTKSCGCRRVRVSGELNLSHGETKTRLYKTWAGMKGRCLNKRDSSFDNYGGKGVVLCQEWRSFEAFRSWAIGNGYSDTLTIERKDPRGNYEPDNCCWVTKKMQARNKRSHRTVDVNGELRKLFEWAEISGIHPETISSRIARGWSHCDAVTKPLDKRGRRHA